MPEQKKSFTHNQTILFIIVLCIIAATTLSFVATVLKEPQIKARELYRSKQLLIAAHILSYDGTFLIQDKNDTLVPTSETEVATNKEILQFFKNRVTARLVDDRGNLKTFEETHINERAYLVEHQKEGYANLSLKLIYLIQADKTANKLPYAYIIPINGYGLWDAIYGYLGIASDGQTVLGTTWYDQKETPGLGGDIALPEWQKQFYQKIIFQKDAEGKIDFSRAPLGITVVKTTVSEIYGDSPKSQNAVDGITGATITSNGVAEAYHDSLEPYRPFFLKAHQRYTQLRQ